jgi:transcriptional regulator with XRE-family HTH domain
MGVRNGPADRARRRIEGDIAHVLTDVSAARRASGLSQRAVAAACGVDQATIARIESRETRNLDVRLLATIATCVGLDLRLQTYPGGDAIRDVAQQRLLARLRRELHPSLRMPTEVPLPGDGDLRAWDAEIIAPTWRRPVEAETVIDDAQAQERRFERKIRDAHVAGIILVVADTRRNRRALDAAPAAFSGFDRDARRILRALRAGLDPGPRALILL